MSQLPNLPDLSNDAVFTYQRVLDGESVAPGTPGLAELLTTGMAVKNHHAGEDTYSPIDPRYPALGMIEQVHAHMVALTTYVGALPGYLATLRDLFQSARVPNDSIQHIKGRELVNDHIAGEHASARTEIISAQPGHRTPDDLAFSYDRDRSALKQGLVMRTLYNSSVRRVATVGKWAKTMAAAGGEIRTLNGRFPRSIIFDRRVAFVPVLTSEGEPPADEAVMVSDPLIVARIAHSFDLFWERADSWYGGSRSVEQGLQTTAMQRAILRELCRGRTQAQAAKNLGIGSAWINEQLGQLRKRLGVQTLNEVIYWWATSPDHELEE